MNTIIAILSIIILVVIAVPALFQFILTKLVGFSVAKIKIKNPLSWIDLLCHIKLDKQGVKHVTINVPKI